MEHGFDAHMAKYVEMKRKNQILEIEADKLLVIILADKPIEQKVVDFKKFLGLADNEKNDL